jgi:outer membrane protein assembly factor BamB
MLSSGLSSSTVITLGSSDPARVTLPANVTIPANQTSAAFQLSVANDSVLNGPENVTVTASGPGYLFKAGTAVITIADDETTALSLTAPASASEGSSFSVTLTAAAAPLNSVQVALSSSSTAVFVPPTVTIPAGQTSVTFTAYAADDGIAGGNRAATITAHVQGWTDGTTNITILDSGTNISSDWTMFGNGPAHTGYQSTTLGASSYQPGWTMSYQPTSTTLNQAAISGGEVFVTPYEYFGTTYLSGLDASTGAELWRHAFTSAYSINPPSVNLGKVYAERCDNSGDSQLWCIDAISGATTWSAPIGAQWERYLAPTIYNNSVWVDGGSYGGLYGFNTATGSQLFFNSSLEQYDQWTPAYYAGTLYTWIAGNFRAHYPQSGAIQWSVNLGWNWSGYDMNTAPVIDLGHAYINAATTLYAIDLATHANIWSVSGTFAGTPATNLGTVFMISSGNVAAFSAATGALLGTYAAGDTGLAGQPIVTPDSIIAASSSKTYIFNRQTFALKQTLSNGGLASLAGGAIYLAGADGVLRTYHPNAPSAPTLSPMAAFTGGASCSANWNTVAGANLYEVQAAANPAFTSPMSSGWINANSYIFTPLADGAQYYYRVHASVNGTASAGAWSAMNSSTQDASAPALAISSPASLSTTSSKLVVQGTASDAVSGVQSISINGVPATSSDGFAHWSATLKNLQPGSNGLTLSASDNAVPANTKTTTVQITGVVPADANGNHLPDFWEAEYGVTGGASGDVHHSGVPNLLAYALDIDPNAVDRSLLPIASAQMNPADGLFYLTLTYRRLLQDLGLTYQIEISSDLVTWDATQSAVEELAPTIPNSDGLSETVTVRIHPALGSSPRYVRLRVFGD